MSKLLRMEYLFNRKPIIIILAIFSLYFAYMVSRISSPRLFLVFTSLMVGLALPFGIVGREDKFKTAAFVCSLPVRRSTVVLAKYVVTWIGIGLALAYALLLAAVIPFSKISVGDILNLKSLLISFALISLFFSFILPFTTRFGMIGIILFLVGTQVLGIVALLLGQFVGPNPLRSFLRFLESSFRSLLDHPVTPGFLVGLVLAILILNASSLTVTRWLYSRKEL